MCQLKKKLENKSVALGDKTSGKIIILFNSENTVLSQHTILAFSPTKMSTERNRISE
jgi:hypothetical protein